MNWHKKIKLIYIVTVMVVQPVLGQTTNRQLENSVHNVSEVDDQTTIQKDTTIREKFGEKLLFEFVGGPSMCFWTPNDNPDQVMFHRYALAFAVVHRTTKTLNLEAKLLWEPKGILLEYNFERQLYKQGIKIDYLTLALTVDHYIDCERRLYIGAGVSAGMLTRQWTFTDTYDENGTKVSSYTSETFEIKKFEMGLIANVGYRRHVWKNMLINIQAFGNLGLTDLTKEFDPDPYPTSRNANLALLIGIGFSL